MLGSKGGGMSGTGCETGVLVSNGKIRSVFSYSSVIFWHAEASLVPPLGRWKSLRFSRLSFAPASTVAGVLGILILLAAYLAAATQVISPTTGAETRSTAWSTIADDHWLAEGLLGDQTGTGSDTAPTQSELAGIRSFDAHTAFLVSKGPNGTQHAEIPCETGGAQKDTSAPAAFPEGSQARQPVERPSLSVLVLLLLFALGMPAIHFVGSSVWQKATDGVHLQRFDKQLSQSEHERETPTPPEEGIEHVEEEELTVRPQENQLRQEQQFTFGMDDCKTGLRQLDELQMLQPLAAHIAKLVGTGESFNALHDFGAKVKKGKQVQQKLLATREGLVESPDRLVADAVGDGLLALSNLYEIAREHGIASAQKIRRIDLPAVFLKREFYSMGVCLGSDLTGLLDFYFEDVNRSFQALVRIVEKVEKRLERLRGIEGMNDWHVMATVAAGFEFINEAHKATVEEAKAFERLKQTADTIIIEHHLREHDAIQRRFAYSVEDHHILCSLQKWRQMDDTASSVALDEVQEQLKEADRLLQKHHGALVKLRREMDISSLQNVKQQAGALAQELETLLEAVANQTESIRIETAETGGHGAKVIMEMLASRAKWAARTSFERVASIQKDMELQMARNGDVETSFVPSAKESLKLEMQRVVRNAEKAVRQASSATEDVQNGGISIPATVSELEAAVKRATSLASVNTDRAETLRLEMDILDTLEFDMRLSAEWARKAAAAVGMETEVHEMPDHWRLSLPFPLTRRFQDLLQQMHIAKRNARFQSRLDDLTATAGTMREISLALLSIVQAQDGINFNPKFNG